ncbi:MAG: RNA recognition motif domain-containing protein [Spirochaetales bacterium]
MANKLYVGNLNYRTEQESLRSLFSQFGEVVSAVILTDRDTGRSRGFGFVEMNDADSASAAIAALNGTEFEGRMLKVNEARERQERSDRGFDRGY